MKDLSSRWAVGILLAPVLLILGLAFIGGSNQASAKAPPAGKAAVAVAFISSFDNSPSITSFQRVALNVISIRLNPSKDPNVSTFDSNWISIPVPGGVGRNVGLAQVSTGNTFGGYVSSGNSVAVGEGKSEIQIDLNAIQNIAEIFNAANIPATTYRQVELVLDNVTPGNVIPLCPTIFPAGEGCVTYQAKFSWTLSTPTPTTTQSIRATIDGGLNLSKSQHVVTPLVIAIDPGVANPPTAFLTPVAITPTIKVIPNSQGESSDPFVNQDLGSLQGTIVTSATGGFSGTRTESITAEVAGTNNIIETILLPNSCNGKKTCDFIMYLPALDASVGGTNYDIVAAGKNTSYAVRSNINVAAGAATDLRGETPFQIVTKSTVSFSGKVLDRSSGVGVQAATLNLLVPDKFVISPSPSPLPTPTPLPTPDCLANPPVRCVVAATASTDEVGNFPLPGNGNNKAPFNLVPLPGTTADTGYEMVTTAAGFNRTLTLVTSNGGRFKCVETLKNGVCNVPMDRGLLTGNVSLGGGATGPVSVLIVAEDQPISDTTDQTQKIENMALVTIRSGSNTAPFTMNVPTVDQVPLLDVFASAQDLFNGAPQTATGHSIAVFSGVEAPCALMPGDKPGACTTKPVNLSPLVCVGHGSVSGTVLEPEGGDTVTLSQSTVQIESVPIIPPANPNAGNYALCAPPGSYTLEQVDSAGTVKRSVTVTLAPPTLEPLPSPTAGASPTPCPVICKTSTNTNGQCSVCTGTSQNIQ